MRDDELAELESLANAAAEGPWRVMGRTVEEQDGYVVVGDIFEPNASFVARCRTAVPALCKALREARELASEAGWAAITERDAMCKQALDERDAALSRIAELEQERSEATQAFAHDLTRAHETCDRLRALVQRDTEKFDGDAAAFRSMVAERDAAVAKADKVRRQWNEATLPLRAVSLPGESLPDCVARLIRERDEARTAAAAEAGLADEMRRERDAARAELARVQAELLALKESK